MNELLNMFKTMMTIYIAGLTNSKSVKIENRKKALTCAPFAVNWFYGQKLVAKGLT